MQGEEYQDSTNGVTVIDESGTGVGIDKLLAEFKALPVSQDPTVASLSNWANDSTSRVRYKGNWGRDSFLDDDDLFRQMKIARRAVERDDVVSGVVESTEALMLKSVRINSSDDDQENVFNQIALDSCITQAMKEIWRELFTVSQAYVAFYWGNKSYTPSNSTDRKRKKKVNLRVPLGITVLDPLKVIPIGNSFFKQDQLIYIATPEEEQVFDKVLSGELEDKMVSSFLIQRHEVSKKDEKRIQENVGRINLRSAYLMNGANVHRITNTKPDYQYFADVRLRSLFELLDLKHQLKAMDRAFLIGGSNMIVVVKKGSDQLPAQDAEIQGLANQVKRSSRVPIIVSDHRLEVEIVTPKLDKTLSPERYNAIDSRITSRMYNILSSGNYASGVAADDSAKLLTVIARNLESKRMDISEFLLKTFVSEVISRNSDFFDRPASLALNPKRIAMSAVDTGYLQQIVDLHLAGRISHHTLLEEFDLDYELEKQLRMSEKEDDEIWAPKDLDMQSAKIGGRIGGGNKNGGGRNPASDAPSPNDKPSKNPDALNND